MRIGLMALACAVLSALAPARAQDAADTWEQDRAGWRVSASAYAWLAGFSGTLRPLRAGPAVSIDESFGEVLENLDAAFFASVMARRDRFVLLGDINYTSSSADGDIAALPGVAADGAFEQTTVLGLAGYRAVAQPTQSLDVYAGLRYWSVESRARARAGGQTLIAVEDRFDWLDPMLAVRWRRGAGPRGQFLAYGDLGGFGVGAERSWQLLALYDHRLHPQWSLSAGYRVLSVDYRDDGHIHDVRLAGPLLGLTWRAR